MLGHARRAPLVGVALVAVFALSACSDDSTTTSGTTPTPAAPTNAVTIKGLDYGYDTGKGSMDAGLATVTFTNAGKDFHMIAWLRLQPGKTIAEGTTALLSEDDKDDEAVFVNTDDKPAENMSGAPQVLTGGQTTTVTFDATAGDYALVCFFPLATGKPHFTGGMIAPFTINPKPAAAPAAPTATAEATLADDKLTLPDLSSGKAVVKLTNTGKESHDFTIAAPLAGKTFEEGTASVDAYFEGKTKIADVLVAVHGGASALDPGETVYVTLDLAPGTYYVICTESADEEGAKEHYKTAPGEKVSFTVA